MTKDEIIRMAKEAGLRSAVLLGAYGNKLDALTDSEQDELEAVVYFAALVAAHEREACAQACESHRDLRQEVRAALRVADALKVGDEDDTLRALRHESDVRLYHTGIDKCASAIRARGRA